ncbi:hypothetical protein M9Y10_003408 [Tritrichomonas musculus]|uniref:DUF3447 domain-containing protein n=1 Tax=Tritrichomonas musculus TaxID=1915356 RepID=A0ABR2JPB4_9EUKA
MNAQNYLGKMQSIQNILLQYIEDSEKSEENYQNLIQLLDDHKIREDKHSLKSLLYLISKISDNHYRGKDFFSKIEQILRKFKDDIVKYFTSLEIFNIFKSNRRVLLFLIEQQIIKIDEQIAKKIKSNNYCHFFYPEIKTFLSEDEQQKISNELPENFEENRKIGQNESHICKLIRKDMIEDFLIVVNQTNLSIKSNVPNSLFETNSFLVGKEIALIEYAAFFGSIQVFNYLYKNGIELKPSLLVYAIHGNNPELIHLLEEKTAKKTVEVKAKQVKEKAKTAKVTSKGRTNPKRKSSRKSNDYSDDDDESYDDSDDDYVGGSSSKKKAKKSSTKSKQKKTSKRRTSDDSDDDSDDEYRGEMKRKSRSRAKKNTKKETVDKELLRVCLHEAIKCHHNEIGKFYIDNYFSIENDITSLCIQFYNFAFIQNDALNESSFYYLCKYDYFIIVDDLLKNKSIEINKKIESEGQKRSKDSEELTALCLAIEEENVEVIKILLQRDDLDVNFICTSIQFDVNHSIEYARDWDNKHFIEVHNYMIESTPLNAAVKMGNVEIVNLLLECDKININLTTKYRDTCYDHWEEFIWGDTKGTQGLSVDNSLGRMILNYFFKSSFNQKVFLI